MPKHRFDPAVRPPTQARANRMHLVKDDNWIKAFLNRAQVGTVSTSWDNLPFNNVTLFWYDETNHRIIFHANVFGHIRANLDHNPKSASPVMKWAVCFPVMRPSNSACSTGVWLYLEKQKSSLMERRQDRRWSV